MESSKYFDFLCDVVGRTYEYSLLLEHLHGIEFYSLVPHDDNRGADGRHLRELYLDEMGPQHGVSSYVFEGPCTVLEMLIGVAQRLELDLEGGRFERDLAECFWLLIDNLGLDWSDNTDFNEEEVDICIENLLERRYESDGSGGLFPLRMAKYDQREVEIWYQMSAWEIENCPI